jgi:hypothetical protein
LPARHASRFHRCWGEPEASVTAISRKKFIDAPIGVVVEARARLRDLLADEHGQELEEQAGEPYTWRCADGCTWNVTFASLADVATWVTLTFEPSPEHEPRDDKAGCRLSRALEAFCSESESGQQQRYSPPPGVQGPPRIILRSAPGVAGGS